MKTLRDMKLLKQGKAEHKPILKKNAQSSKKKVTFMAQDDTAENVPAKTKEHKRLKSPPKERPEAENKAEEATKKGAAADSEKAIEDKVTLPVAEQSAPVSATKKANVAVKDNATLLKAIAEQSTGNKQAIEKDQIVKPEVLSKISNEKMELLLDKATPERIKIDSKASIEKTKPDTRNSAEKSRSEQRNSAEKMRPENRSPADKSKPESRSSAEKMKLSTENIGKGGNAFSGKKEHKLKPVASDTALTENVFKPVKIQTNHAEPEKKEEPIKEASQELVMPKPKKKQISTSTVYARMKALHKKRKEVFNLGGSVRDVTKGSSKAKKSKK